MKKLPAANRRGGWRLRTPHSFKVNAKRALLLLALAIPAVVAVASDRVSLGYGARQIDLHPETSVMAAAMMLKGSAFLAVDPAGVPGEPTLRPDWPTLDALALPGGRFLLADRFGVLRLVEVPVVDGKCQPREIANWPVEGTPTGLWATEDYLLVASASAGLLTFHWDGSSAPRLASRYPFVDYSKEIRLRDDGVAVLADNWDTGLQILNLSDPLRPEHLATVTGGFIDSVAIAGDTVAIVDRKRSARVYTIRSPRSPQLLFEVPSLPHKDPRGGDLKRVVFSPSSRLMVCEGPAGAQLVTFYLRDGKPDSKTVFVFNDAGVNDAVFLTEETVLLSLMNGEIRRVQLPAR